MTTTNNNEPMSNTTPSPAAGSEELRSEVQKILRGQQLTSLAEPSTVFALEQFITAQNNATYEAVVEALKDERTKIVHRNGSWDWVEGALARNQLRAELRQSIAKIFLKESSDE